VVVDEGFVGGQTLGSTSKRIADGKGGHRGHVQTEVGNNSSHCARVDTGEKLDERRHVRTESREIRNGIEKSAVRWKTIQPNSHLIDQAENPVEFGSLGVVRAQCVYIAWQQVGRRNRRDPPP
jgi:hypothetical protein